MRFRIEEMALNLTNESAFGFVAYTSEGVDTWGDPVSNQRITVSSQTTAPIGHQNQIGHTHRLTSTLILVVSEYYLLCFMKPVIKHCPLPFRTGCGCVC